MKSKISFLAGFGLLLIASTSEAQIQTWVSGVGDDTNPCTRTAPCKSFEHTISVTPAAGEITVLDEGDFGPVTITKSMTISGESTRAGITTPPALSGTNAIVVNAGATDVVRLRGLSLNGGGNGLNGIQYLAGGTLLIDHCAIHGFTQSGIEVSSLSGNLVVKNSTLTNGAAGIQLTITTSVGMLAQVTNSSIAGFTAYGVHSDGKGMISVMNSLLTNNRVAVRAERDATVRLSNNDIFDNPTGFSGCAGGRIVSAGNNRRADSPGCHPSAPPIIVE